MAQPADLPRLGGYLPATPRAEMVEANFRLTGETILNVLEKHQVPDVVFEDVVVALRTRVGARTNGHHK